MTAQLAALRAQLKDLRERAGQSATADAIAAFDQKLGALEGERGGRFGGGGRGAARGPDTLATVNGAMSLLLASIEGADAAPTRAAAAAVADRRKAMAGLVQKWRTIAKQDLAALNTRLKQANLPALTLAPTAGTSR